MFRKTLIAFAALGAIGAAAFAISIPVASAQGYNQHRHHQQWRPAIRHYSPSYNYYGSCFLRRVIHTPYGPRVTWTNICN